MAKKEKQKKKTSIWKVLRTIAIVGGGVFIGAALLNVVGLSIGLGAFASTILANVALVGAVAGIASIGGAAATSVVTGLVNGLRYIFSKKYREQVKANRLAKKQAKQQTRNNNEEKNLTQENKNELTDDLENNKNKGKEAETPVVTAETTETSVVEETTVETPVVEEIPAPTPKEENIYKGIASKKIFSKDYSAREYLALQQIYSAQKKELESKIATIDSNDTKALKDANKELKKVTVLENRAFNMGKKKALAEGIDTSNSISTEEREIFIDFGVKGRKSTKVKNLEITDSDRKNADEASKKLDEEATKRTGR